MAASGGTDRPLADRMRPASLDEFSGQRHLLDEGKPLQRAIGQGRAHSMIFWGPPGTGKTTLARMIASTTDSHFIALSAVMAGVKDIRAAVAEAQQERQVRDRGTVLFLDEVHRFNKSQQDAFLPHIEDGTILFVGTKRAARDVVREEAERCGMPYVNHRWLGGMLTNYKTVRASIKRLKDQPEDNRVLILLTDGSSTTGHIEPVQAARLAARVNVRIYTIGIGNTEATGEDRVDFNTLAAIARRAGGQFFNAENEEALDAVYRRIDETAVADVRTQSWRPRESLVHWPAGAAVILVLAAYALLLAGSRRRGVPQ